MRACVVAHVALVVALLYASAAAAQVAAGAWVDAGADDGPEHAWVVARSPAADGWALWHLPPRVGRGAAPDGSARPVLPLAQPPVAMAAAGPRVWMIFPRGNTGYSSLTVAALPGAIEGTWHTASSRPDAGPFLETRSLLLAAAARDDGPMVLLERTTGELEFAWVDDGRWVFADGPRPPPDVPDAGIAVGVVAGDRAGVVLPGPDALWSWEAVLPEVERPRREFTLADPDARVLGGDSGASTPAEPERVALDWASSAVGYGELAGKLPLGRGEVVAGPASVGDRWVAVVDHPGGRHAVEASPQEARLLSPVPAGGVALLGVARRGVVVLESEEADASRGRAATRLEIREFSLDTGRVLYVGPAVFDGPISPSDLRLMFVLLIAISAAALLFIVRTSAEAAPLQLPAGCTLVPPFPRIMSASIDLALAYVVGGWLAASLPEGWLAIRVGVDAIDFAPVLMTLFVGWGAGSALEAAFGRSPGKLLFGMAVVRGGTPDRPVDGPRAPGLLPSMARNAVKWLLPPVALAGVLGRAFRHRGDTLTGTAVVQLPEPANDADESADEES